MSGAGGGVRDGAWGAAAARATCWRKVRRLVGIRYRVPRGGVDIQGQSPDNCGLPDQTTMTARRLLSTFLFMALSASAAVQTPEQYFGFRIGSDKKLARWDRSEEHTSELQSLRH